MLKAEMGSCENLISVDEPSGDSVSERHLCLETNFDVVDANVNGSMKSDRCLALSNDDATLCVGSANVGDTGIGNKDGLACEYRNLVGVGLEKVLDDECRVGRVCSNENRGEIGVYNSPYRNLGLSRDGKCAYITEVIVGDRDGSVSECENVACSVLENLEDDEEQGVCLNESQSEIDGCCAETNGLCLEKRGLRGKDLESFEHRKLSLGEMPKEMPNNSSLRNCDRQEKQKGNRGVNFSSVEETVEVMDEETNVLAEVKVDNDNHHIFNIIKVDNDNHHIFFEKTRNFNYYHSDSPLTVKNRTSLENFLKERVAGQYEKNAKMLEDEHNYLKFVLRQQEITKQQQQMVIENNVRTSERMSTIHTCLSPFACSLFNQISMSGSESFPSI